MGAMGPMGLAFHGGFAWWIRMVRHSVHGAKQIDITMHVTACINLCGAQGPSDSQSLGVENWMGMDQLGSIPHLVALSI